MVRDPHKSKLQEQQQKVLKADRHFSSDLPEMADHADAIYSPRHQTGYLSHATGKRQRFVKGASGVERRWT